MENETEDKATEISRNLKISLVERSKEIQYLVAQELSLLEIPCSISDMVKRVNASRVPVERRVRELIATQFTDISITKVGGYDVIYRKVSRQPQPVTPEPKPEQEQIGVK